MKRQPAGVLRSGHHERWWDRNPHGDGAQQAAGVIERFAERREWLGNEDKTRAAGPDQEVVLDRVATVPNLISAIRIFLIPLFAWAFLSRSRDALAFGLLVLIGSSDWIDGYVARRTGQVSRLGKLLDPVADRAAVAVILVALTVRGVVALPLAAALLARDLIVSIVFPILEARGFPRIPVNKTGKWATAFIFAGMAVAASSIVFSGMRDPVRAWAAALLAAGAVLYWSAAYLYAIQIRHLMKLRRIT